MPLPHKVHAGEIFDLLTVIEPIDDPRPERYYLCRCECGETAVASAKVLRGGHKGCCKIARHPERSSLFRHGLTDTPTWRSWKAMQTRCANPAASNYSYYGGRGISIYARWLGPDGFINFHADMGERPEGMTLDRIDPDGDYEPSNCRWATASDQTTNRRKSRHTEATKARISAAKIGKPLSREHREKLSIAQKRRHERKRG